MTSIVTEETRTPVVQMTLSTGNTVDLMGRFLPAGNYYFTAKRFYKDMISGSLQSRGEGFGEFCFTNKVLVQMMAVAQARLGRRADIKEEGMPTYSSPKIQKKERRPRPVSPPLCSICYDSITTDLKTLRCKHVFHNRCIHQWMATGKNTCPLCRASVTTLPAVTRRRVPRVVPRPPPSQYPSSGRPVYNRYSMYRRHRG